jgi:hypothetical protein
VRGWPFILELKSFANILREITNPRIALKIAALIVGGSFLTPAHLKGSGNHSVRLSFGKKTKTIVFHLGEIACFDGERDFR